MRLGIVGSRNWEKNAVEAIKQRIPVQTTLIVSGGSEGIDRFAVEAARELHISYIEILPEYERYGKRAPLLRNEKIAENVDRLLAFWDYRSRGTASTIVACIERGVPVEIVGPEEL